MVGGGGRMVGNDSEVLLDIGTVVAEVVSDVEAEARVLEGRDV